MLAAAIWSVAYARATLGPLQEAMRLTLTLSDRQIAWLQGPALAIPMTLGAVPLGLVVNKYSRSRLLFIFVTVSLLATVLSAVAPTLGALYLCRCLVGFALAAVTIAAYSMVADFYRPANRGRATMIVAIGEVGGAPAAFALGGALLAAGLSAHQSGLEAWRRTLLEMSVALLPVALLTLWVREPPRTDLSVSRPSLRQVWPEFLAHRSVIGSLLLARSMMWIADGAVLVWAAPIFARRFHLPPDRIGTIMGSALMASGLLGPLLGGPLADICQRTGGPRRTVTALTILAASSAPAALFALAPYPAMSGFLLSLFLTLGYMLGTAALTLGTVVLPGELRGVYLGLTVTIGALFFVGVAPLAISELEGVLGGEAMVAHAVAIACGTTSMMGALTFVLARKHFPKCSSAHKVVAS